MATWRPQGTFDTRSVRRICRSAWFRAKWIRSLWAYAISRLQEALISEDKAVFVFSRLHFRSASSAIIAALSVQRGLAAMRKMIPLLRHSASSRSLKELLQVTPPEA